LLRARSRPRGGSAGRDRSGSIGGAAGVVVQPGGFERAGENTAVPGRRVQMLAAAAVLATAFVAVTLFRTWGGRPTPHGPSIVLILTDDQRWNTLAQMPNVERLLVHHGVQFTNGFVVNSLCCPSRASILTGDYSHTTGVY